MSDESQPPSSSLVFQPDLFTIPYQLLEQWAEIPHNERVTLDVTRLDIDRLLVGLLKICDAQTKLDQALVDWSNGNTAQATTAILEFRRYNADAQNNLRQLATALMTAGLRRHAR